ncbi:MAG TPA: hypothetical protein ENJ04_04350 [Nitrospirae bacterium]|nr:hypothetical protein [Nitrospirota bacterium]
MERLRNMIQARGPLGKVLSLMTAVLFILSAATASSDDTPTIAEYTAYPPFGGKLVKPNVLINLDASTSLNYFAYDFNWNARTSSGGRTAIPTSVGFDPDTQYYGYFDPHKWYEYASAVNEFQAVGNKSATNEPKPAGAVSWWDGNFLNWLTMRRADIIKKAIIGGRTKARAGITGGHPDDLIGRTAHIKLEGYEKALCVAEDGNIDPSNYTPYSDCPLTFSFDNATGTSTEPIAYFTVNSATYYVTVHRGSEPEGVFQRVGGSVRWGLELITDGTTDDTRNSNCIGETGNSGGGPIIPVDGGTVVVPVGYYNSVKDAIIDNVANSPLVPSTPLAESLWTATGYFAQDGTTSSTGPRYTSNTTGSYTVSSATDPYNYALDPFAETRWIPCARSFVITITDGEPTADLQIPTTLKGYGSAYADGPANEQYTGVPDWADTTTTVDGALLNYFWDPDLEGSHYMDNVAYYGHADTSNNKYRDLRDDTTDFGLPADEYDQNLTHYFIYATFGGNTPDGRRLLNWSSGTGTPPNDYPSGGGGAARNGGFTEIGTNYEPDLECEYNADYDESDDNFFEARNGYELEAALLKALFRIIEQTSSGTSPALAGSRNGEGNLVYQASFYPEKTFPEGKRSWLGYLKAFELDSDGNISQTPLWDAGERLWERDISTLPRLIYTTLDGSNLIEFKEGNGLDNYLRAADSAEAADIIRYIHGVDIPGYRPRTISGNVWKLGDIVYSSPTPVGTPGENYDRLYRDVSYTSFYLRYKNRRTVVYAGANDGMLHAFNAGKYNPLTGRYETGGLYAPLNKELALGDELWGFIPKQLLPHLKWLTDPNYTHVYYVDLKPKVTDVRIFCDETNPNTDCINGQPNVAHPNGWGTILIGGMRLGGKEMAWTAGGIEYRTSPAYFALDITDPEAPPKLLWTFTNRDSNSDGNPDLGLGLTTSYPAVARVLTDTKDLWVMIVGSGPTDFDAGSNVRSGQTGRVFVVDLKSGNLLKIFDTGVGDAFMTDPITVDVNLDYRVDVAYIGGSYDSGAGYGSFSGNMYRIVTNNSTDVNTWTLSTLISTSGYRPVTSAPSAALDDKGNLWVFFGAGKLIGSEDKIISDAQAFYGVKDICKPWKNTTCTTAVSETDLLDVSGVTIDIGATDITATGTDIPATTCGDSSKIEWCDLLSAVDSKDGWIIQFPGVPGHEGLKGERSIIKPVVIGGLVIFTSYVPEEDICSNDQGDGYLWAVYYETGTAYKDYVFSSDIAATPDTVGREQRLGDAVAGISAMVTRGSLLKTLAQTSIGNIPGIEIKAPFSLDSAIVGWRAGACRE